MTAARAWGVPLSILRGRPWPLPGEPLFTDEDRDWAVALIVDERESCPGCGEPLAISTAAESEEQYHADALRCWGCVAQARAGRDVDDPTGLLVQFNRRPNPEE